MITVSISVYLKGSIVLSRDLSKGVSRTGSRSGSTAFSLTVSNNILDYESATHEIFGSNTLPQSSQFSQESSTSSGYHNL